jgi:uncharacterized protein YraI
MNHNWEPVLKFLMQSRAIFGVVILSVFLGIVSCNPGINEKSTTSRQTSTSNEINSSAKSVSSNVKIVATATVTKTQKVTLSGCVDNAKYLNVRSGPSSQYSINDYLSEGDCVTLIKRNADNTWVKFSKGWVSLAFIKVAGNISRLPVAIGIQATLVKPTPANPIPTQLVSTSQQKPTSTPKPKPTSTPKPKKNKCHPSYPGVCIPPPPPDLDCKHINYCRFKVLPPDPHGFDGDRDGIGCEVCP